MRQALGFGQISLAPPESFLGALAFRDIDRNAHYFNNVSIAIQDGMGYAVEVFDCSTGQHDSKFQS
jgi:hypothetical protein